MMRRSRLDEGVLGVFFLAVYLGKFAAAVATLGAVLSVYSSPSDEGTLWAVGLVALTCLLVWIDRKAGFERDG